MRKFTILIGLLVVICTQINATSSKVDRLDVLLQKAKDTAKLSILFQLIDLVSDNDPEKCLNYINQAAGISNKHSLKVYEARCLQMKAQYLKKHGDYSQALDLFKEAATKFQNEHNLLFLASTYNNIGATYVDKGDYENSAIYLLKALKIFEQINNKPSIGKAYLNIGLVFYYQRNFDKALEYYYKSLEIRKTLNDPKAMGLVYNNMGVIYSEKKNTKLAIENYKKSIECYSKLGNLRGMSDPLFNIAELYYIGNKPDSALVYYKKSYTIDTILKDKIGTSSVLLKLASIYNENESLDAKPFTYAFEALKLAQEAGSKADIKDAYSTISDLYKRSGKWEKALAYAELASNLKDSIYSKQSSEAIAELQTKYETEKKDIQLNQQNETIHNQKLIFKILLIGILLALIFISQILIQFIQKKKAYKVLEEQKRNITDSINYASRIQTALLPPVDVLNKLLPNHFVLYKPRDIVSGDFYWITISGNKTIIAVADCTGHGVPGAFMSMLGFAYLNEIANKTPDISADEILNQLRDKVRSALHQGEDSESKDGMDIALAIINPASKSLQFSGANNPLLICRKNEIISLVPDKMPIGVHSFEGKSFTLQETKLEDGDFVYMFSDGYMDQFGGEKMKKFGKLKFEKVLAEASKMSIKAQKYYLEEKILEWMIDTEQIDDILVLGVQI